MNPLYEMLMSRQMAPNSPMNKMQMMMQAMTNPAAFVRRSFPDIPEYMQNNPVQILQYLQQTRGISNQQIQSLLNQYPSPNYF